MEDFCLNLMLFVLFLHYDHFRLVMSFTFFNGQFYVVWVFPWDQVFWLHILHKSNGYLYFTEVFFFSGFIKRFYRIVYFKADVKRSSHFGGEYVGFFDHDVQNVIVLIKVYK